MTDVNDDVVALESRKDIIKELQASAPNLREEPLTDEMRNWFDGVCAALSPLIEIDAKFNLIPEIDILIKCLEDNSPATEQRKKTADEIKTILDVALSETESRIQYLNKVAQSLSIIIDDSRYDNNDNIHARGVWVEVSPENDD